MADGITITAEVQNRGTWIKVFIPPGQEQHACAFLKTGSGEVLKKVWLCGGSNAIDISQISQDAVFIKVETLFETIFKEIKINPQ